MARNLNRIKTNTMDEILAWYDSLSCPNIEDLLPIEVIEALDTIADDARIPRKRDKIDAIRHLLEPYGFIRKYAGTNRQVYLHPKYPNIALKVATNIHSINDSIREMRNQDFLKPFCTKTFWHSYRGAVGLFEAGEPIMTQGEFDTHWDQIEMMLASLSEDLLLCDIGSKAIKNYVIRKGFGPVVCDYTFLYRIMNESDLYCKYCHHALEYDRGYNEIYCPSCGTKYQASDIGRDTLELAGGGSKKILVDKNHLYMRDDIMSTAVVYKKKEDIVYESDRDIPEYYAKREV